MAEIDSQILKDFLVESKTLIERMTDILEKCEGDLSQAESLEEYGQNVDRIMGAAKSLGVSVKDPQALIHKIGDYAAICKAVGYKASQIRDNSAFYDVCVALLLDGTEVLGQMLDGVSTGKNEIKELFSKTFLERLKWVSAQFGAQYRATVENKAPKVKMNQSEIDDLMKKLGLD